MLVKQLYDRVLIFCKNIIDDEFKRRRIDPSSKIKIWEKTAKTDNDETFSVKRQLLDQLLNLNLISQAGLNQIIGGDPKDIISLAEYQSYLRAELRNNMQKE